MELSESLVNMFPLFSFFESFLTCFVSCIAFFRKDRQQHRIGQVDSLSISNEMTDDDAVVAVAVPPNSENSPHPPLPLPLPPALPIGRMIISIKDSGLGFTTEQLNSFNSSDLQQALVAGNGSGNRNDLGLWIAKKFVSLHGGDLTIRSQGLGCGTDYVISLPMILRETHYLNSNERQQQQQRQQQRRQRMSSSPSASAIPSASASASATTLASASAAVQNVFLFPFLCNDSPLHILLVDDSLVNRRIYSRLLKKAITGCICYEAQNGQECVEMVLSGEYPPFDFILLDDHMPFIDGPIAARILRERRCEILIIGWTGCVQPEDIQTFIEHGANVVLPKPLNLNHLFECVNSYLAMRTLSSSPES
jgi:CheY-like chemotaxis protein